MLFLRSDFLAAGSDPPADPGQAEQSVPLLRLQGLVPQQAAGSAQQLMVDLAASPQQPGLAISQHAGEPDDPADPIGQQLLLLLPGTTDIGQHAGIAAGTGADIDGVDIADIGGRDGWGKD